MNANIRLNIKSKKTLTDILFNFLFLFIWLIIGFNTDNVDYSTGYSEKYYDLSQNYFEIGFRSLNILGRALGMSFFQFRLVIMTIMLLLLRNSIKSYSESPVYVAFLYMIYPCLLQSVQIRNALASAIILYALRFLDEEKEHGCFKYVLLVLLGASIHKIVLIYLVLVFTKQIKIPNILKLSITIFTSLYLIIVFFQEKILHLLYILLKDDRLYIYAHLSEKHLFIKSMLPYIIVGILFCYLYNIKHGKKQKLENITSLDKMLLKTSILTLSFLPLFLIDGNYFRIWAFFLPVIYTSLLNLNKYRGMFKNDKWIIQSCCLMLAMGLFFIDLSPYDPSGYINVTKAVMQNNALREWLE